MRHGLWLPIGVASLSLVAPVARGNDLGAALLEISSRASLQVTSELTLRATTAETSCARGDERCRRCAWGACWSEHLPVEVAAALHREAYALDGPTLRDVADRLGVARLDLAMAIIQRVPVAPTEAELTRLLELASK